MASTRGLPGCGKLGEGGPAVRREHAEEWIDPRVGVARREPHEVSSAKLKPSLVPLVSQSAPPPSGMGDDGPERAEGLEAEVRGAGIVAVLRDRVVGQGERAVGVQPPAVAGGRVGGDGRVGDGHVAEGADAAADAATTGRFPLIVAR